MHSASEVAACRHILLTGRPGCGKTTVVQKTLELLGGVRAAGFYTVELREGGRRIGFDAVGLGGRRVPLARVGADSAARVGRYGVLVQRFEELLADELQRAGAEVDLFVVDEIGKMECFSERFVKLVSGVLDGPRPLLGTIAARGGGFIAEVKARPDVKLMHVTASNRAGLPQQLAELLARLIGRPEC